MNDTAQDGWRPRRPDGGTVTAGPFATDAEAAAAARALGGPPEPGWSILSPEQRLAMLTKACEDAGVTLGACDARVLTWLAGWEDGVCAVIAGLVTRAHGGGLTPEQARRAEWRRSLRGPGSGADYLPPRGGCAGNTGSDVGKH